LTRENILEYKTSNFIVSINDNNEASIVIIQREESEIIKQEYFLERESKFQYMSEEMTLTIDSDKANLQWEGEEYIVHEVKRKNKETTLSSIEQILVDNYVVWANEHQITDHDLRADSLCYLYRRPEREPYDTTKWFLLSIADEYFLTFSDVSNSIPRIEIKNGSIYLTHCQTAECQEYEALLERK
jgi:hypothetical protein